jgi:hypothetical protein
MRNSSFFRISSMSTVLTFLLHSSPSVCAIFTGPESNRMNSNVKDRASGGTCKEDVEGVQLAIWEMSVSSGDQGNSIQRWCILHEIACTLDS